MFRLALIGNAISVLGRAHAPGDHSQSADPAAHPPKPLATPAATVDGRVEKSRGLRHRQLPCVTVAATRNSTRPFAESG